MSTVTTKQTDKYLRAVDRTYDASGLFFEDIDIPTQIRSTRSTLRPTMFCIT